LAAPGFSAHYLNAPTAHDVTQDYKLFVVDGDGLRHLTAPMSAQNSALMAEVLLVTLRPLQSALVPELGKILGTANNSG
jgi:hypothetical protein